MKLENLKTLWGIEIVKLREHAKKYRFRLCMLYFIDIVVVVGLTAYMFYNNIDYSTYGFIILAVGVLINLFGFSKLSSDKWDAFKFYKRHKGYEVVEKTYQLDESRLYNILYCVAFRRLSEGKTMNIYQEWIKTACTENINGSKSIMKYMRKYEDISGNVVCYIITKGKNQYFIDFKEVKGDNENEFNNRGNIEEFNTEDAD